MWLIYLNILFFLSFFFLNRKYRVIFFHFYSFLFSFLFFWNDEALNCALVQSAWICWDTTSTFWSLTCHWHLLMKPSPIPIPTHPPSWPTPCLPMTLRPAKTHSGPFCFLPLWEVNLCSLLFSGTFLGLTSNCCRPWAQNGLGALGMVSAGCRGLIRAVGRHDHLLL